MPDPVPEVPSAGPVGAHAPNGPPPPASPPEAQLAATLESMSDAFLVLDASWRLTYVNPAAARVWGRDRAELVGRDLWTALPEVAGSEDAHAMQRAMRERATVAWEASSPVHGRRLAARAYPTADGGVAVCYQEAVGRERADAEHATFRVIAERSNDAQFLLDEHGRVRWANALAAECMGYTVEELTARTIGDLNPLVPTAAFGPFFEQARGGRMAPFESVHRRKDGVTFPVEITPTVVELPDGPRMLAAVRDITERKQADAALRESEARFRAVEDASPDGSVLMRPERDGDPDDPDGGRAGAITDFTFVYANPATARLLGPGAEALVGRRLCELYPDSRANGYLAGYARAFEAGEPFEVEADYSRAGRPVHLTIAAVRAGDLVHVRFADVSAAVEARAERERLLTAERGARAEAEAANRVKGEFLATMSHELRTPLNAIGGYAELMEMGLHGPVTADQRTALGRIQRSQRALLSVINEVLNYARLETGAVTYELADVPVAEAVAEAETLVAPHLRAKGLSYTWGGCAPGAAVRADRDKLQQVLRNLLSNAIKFTNVRPGLAGHIEASCAADADGRRVHIRIRDTGIGIPADKLEAVFEPFVQVDQGLTRPHEGTGLGLAISRDLARGMGGDRTAESAVGVGSTFTLTLPAAGGRR